MTFLIISDLHLGDGSKEDKFQYDSNGNKLNNPDLRLMEWIKKINPDVLVLAGDIYDFWKFSGQGITDRYKFLLNYIERRKSVFLIGERDYSLIGKKTYSIPTFNGKFVHIEHGYDNDPRMNNIFSKFGIWILSFFEMFRNNSDSILSKMFPNIQNEIEHRTLERATKLLLKNHYVVLGHTHNIKIDNMYFNCGSCSQGKLEGVFINSEYNTINNIYGE